MFAAGVNMIAGTDAGIAPIEPPDVIRWAIPQFQQLGMTAAQALHACTAGAASAIGLGHRKGHLRPGYDADILAIDGDLLGSGRAARHPRGVRPRHRGHGLIQALSLCPANRTRPRCWW
jgi:imidazolonepropionase-like amidohydrolase